MTETEGSSDKQEKGRLCSLLHVTPSSKSIKFTKVNHVEKTQVLGEETRSCHCGSAVMNPTSIPEDVGLIPGLAPWVGVSGGVGHRHGSDRVLLRLWRRMAVAVLTPGLGISICHKRL